MEKTVLIKSKQAGVIVQHQKPSFKYEFHDHKPQKIPEVHAEIILRNPNFVKVKVSKKGE